MIDHIPPSLLLVFAAPFIPLLKGWTKSLYMLLLPLVALIILLNAPEGTYWTIHFLDYDLILGRVDRLSKVFGYVFAIVTFIGVLFALKVEDDLQHVSALIYAGSALGVTFAGDLVTLYLFWELMAISSTFLILARRTRAAQRASFRYILMHLFGGLCLLAGIILHISNTGTTAFAFIGLNGIDSYLIFIGVAVNSLVPPFYPWVEDSYPEATVTGAVFLSGFTTKSAVYVLARTFPGTEILIGLGALMTAFPIFYAVLENDIRRVLAYSLINQVGFMVCGIGIGTPLAMNGTVSHAFCHVIYKALLFMATGSVLQMTGKIRCTDMGGLYKTMPLTCIFCMVGAASISAFPLFSGFVSKSMIVSAAGQEKLAIIWLVLQFASAGVIHHHGVKVPYFTFFSADSGIRTKEPPLNMMLAMGIAAVLCVGIAVYPGPLYDILPYPVDYVPYTAAHVVGMLQLLMYGVLAFCLLVLSGYYPPEMRAINLDLDWFYRKGAGVFYRTMDRGLNSINALSERFFVGRVARYLSRLSGDAPARMVVLAMTPIWRLRGRKMDNEEVHRSLITGTLPIGIGAAVATIFLLVVFLLS